MFLEAQHLIIIITRKIYATSVALYETDGRNKTAGGSSLELFR